jgi:hypothetical protein
MRMRRSWAALAAGVVLAATGATGVTGASADEPGGARPVTVPDTVTTKALQPVEITPLANDSDPDGDELTICRLGPVPAGLEAFNLDDEIVAQPERAGTFTLDYYACDFQYLTKGTITIVATPATVLRVQVRKTHQPGKLRVVNHSSEKVSFAWGSVKEKKADGSRWLRPGQRTVFTVKRHSIVWVAADADGTVYVVHAVRGIDLPRGAKALPDGAPKGHHLPEGFGSDSRLAPAWRAR